MRLFSALYSLVFGCWIGTKMEKWAQEKIWNLKERSVQKIRVIRFQQWTVCFLLVVCFTIISVVVTHLIENIIL